MNLAEKIQEALVNVVLSAANVTKRSKDIRQNGVSDNPTIVGFEDPINAQQEDASASQVSYSPSLSKENKDLMNYVQGALRAFEEPAYVHLNFEPALNKPAILELGTGLDYERGNGWLELEPKISLASHEYFPPPPPPKFHLGYAGFEGMGENTSDLEFLASALVKAPEGTDAPTPAATLTTNEIMELVANAQTEYSTVGRGRVVSRDAAQELGYVKFDNDKTVADLIKDYMPLIDGPEDEPPYTGLSAPAA